MVKKIISIILILLGLTVLGLGIGSGTIWKPEEAVTLKTGELDNALLVATSPGVVHQVNSHFEMTVTAPGDVALIVGNTVDVTGWIGADAHWLVTGATDWEKLNTQFVAEKADPDANPEEGDQEPAKDDAAQETPAVSPIANLAKSDMWYQVVEGKDTVTLTMDKVPDNVIFLAGSLDPEATQAPEISLTWDREVATPLMLPGILVGALLLAVGILLLIDSLRHTPDWTELEAHAILAGAHGSKKTDLELESDPALATRADGRAQSPSEVVSAWDGGSGSSDEPDDPELTDSLKADAGSAASSFAPKAGADELGADEEDVDLDAQDFDAQDFDADDFDADDSDAEPFVFTPVTANFADHDDADLDSSLDAESGSGVAYGEVGSDEVVKADELLLPGEPVAGGDAPESESWFGRLFGKKAKEPKAARVLTPLEPLATAETDAEFAVPSEPFALRADQDVATPAEPDNETQAALEVFAAMDEPDVTTGALQAAGLTRRQLREMRERKEQSAQRNVPTTTGSLDFGGPVIPPGPSPERPSWLPEGSDSTSASSWRAAWGVRPEGSVATDTSSQDNAGQDNAGQDTAGQDTGVQDAPAHDAAAQTAPAQAAGADTAPVVNSQDGAVSETDASSEKATPPPTTRRALYSAYREAAERIANQDAEQEQPK